MNRFVKLHLTISSVDVKGLTVKICRVSCFLLCTWRALSTFPKNSDFSHIWTDSFSFRNWNQNDNRLLTKILKTLKCESDSCFHFLNDKRWWTSFTYPRMNSVLITQKSTYLITDVQETCKMKCLINWTLEKTKKSIKVLQESKNRNEMSN